MRFLSVIISSIIIWLLLWFLYNFMIAPFRRKKILQRAISEGKVVIAQLSTTGYGPSDMENFSNYTRNTYVYEINNREYKFRAFFSGSAPETVKLYYNNNPARATVHNKIGKLERPGILFAIVLAINIVSELI